MPKGECDATKFSRGVTAPVFTTYGYKKYGKVKKYARQDQSAHTLVLSPWPVFSMCADPIVHGVTELMPVSDQISPQTITNAEFPIFFGLGHDPNRR